MARRRRTPRGVPISKRKFGSPPSPSALRKEFAPQTEGTTCPFKFVVVAVVLSADDPRVKRRPRVTDVKVYLDVIREHLLGGWVYASVGHVPLEPKTIVFLVKKEGSTYQMPELRCYSTARGWVRPDD